MRASPYQLSRFPHTLTHANPSALHLCGFGFPFHAELRWCAHVTVHVHHSGFAENVLRLSPASSRQESRSMHIT